jgi:hypothetical protein
MALMSVQFLSKSGVAPTYAAVNSSDTFANNGKTFLHVKNGGGSPINVTINSQVTNPPEGTAAANVVVAVANGTEKMIGPLSQAGYNDSAGIVTVNYSGTTTVTAGVFSL